MLRIAISAVFILLMQVKAQATQGLDWLSSMNLTEKQVELLQKWHNENRYPEEKLKKFAKSYEKINRETKPYIPPHNYQEIMAVMHWAEGEAFNFFARFAGYKFDSHRYMQDCPNHVLFNFGRATGEQYLRHDVLRLVLMRLQSLQFMYSHSPDTFAERFFQVAKDRGFDVYLTPEKPN